MSSPCRWGPPWFWQLRSERLMLGHCINENRTEWPLPPSKQEVAPNPPNPKDVRKIILAYFFKTCSWWYLMISAAHFCINKIICVQEYYMLDICLFVCIYVHVSWSVKYTCRHVYVCVISGWKRLIVGSIPDLSAFALKCLSTRHWNPHSFSWLYVYTAFSNTRSCCHF